MSKTLNLIDILLTTGRHLFMMGRFIEARDPLTKLAGFRKLPEHVVEELQSLLAEIALQQKDYRAARRHLTAAIALRPLKAEFYHLMAIAIEEDHDTDRRRAERYFARAVELEPNEALYFVDFGSYLFTIGKSKEGLKWLRKGYTLGITDAEIVGQVAEVLRREGYGEEATTKLRAALFHNHGSAPFRQLWQQHQFALIHTRQQKPSAPVAERPVILPFVPSEGQGRYVELGDRLIRIDQAEELEAPHNQQPLPFRRPPRKG